MLARVCGASATVIVMASRARLLLKEAYGVPLDRIRLVPHGVPDTLNITEMHIFKFNISLKMYCLNVTGFTNLALRIQHFENPISNHHSHLQGIEFVGYLT